MAATQVGHVLAASQKDYGNAIGGMDIDVLCSRRLCTSNAPVVERLELKWRDPQELQCTARNHHARFHSPLVSVSFVARAVMFHPAKMRSVVKLQIQRLGDELARLECCVIDHVQAVRIACVEPEGQQVDILDLVAMRTA